MGKLIGGFYAQQSFT